MAEMRFEGATRVYPGAEVAAVHELDLTVEDGELMVLVGPSGSGKTTALRMLAGLEEVYAGTIFIGDRDVTDELPKDRDVAMVFQNYALYPYLDVAANIAFPLKMARVPKAERERRVREAAEMLELAEYLARKPNQLSGGQRQRVAMGRAIVREPKAFLMDEPLSNLDAKLRVQMRADIAALQERLGVTTVYVTHDQVEAMTMGAPHRGAPGRRAAAVRRAARRLRAPGQHVRRRLHRVARDEPGRGARQRRRLRAERRAPGAPGGRVNAASALGRVIVGLRPESLEPGGAGVGARVDQVEELGSEAYAFCTVDLPDGEQRLIVRIDSRRPPKRGERLTLQPRRDEAHVFDPHSGRRLG